MKFIHEVKILIPYKLKLNCAGFNVKLECRGLFQMGELREFPLKYRLFLKIYPWRRSGSVPWTPLQKPLKDSRLVLISTAGLILPDQEPFDKSIRGGDCSFREIPSDVDASALIDTHRSDLFDHFGVRQDPNLTFPIDRVQELEKKGRIGSVNRRHLSFMGSITTPKRLVKKTLPGVAHLLKTDAVDAALLIPV
jgi:D-proline reductase (dithiol) PrdB